MFSLIFVYDTMWYSCMTIHVISGYFHYIRSHRLLINLYWFTNLYLISLVIPLKIFQWRWQLVNHFKIYNPMESKISHCYWDGSHLINNILPKICLGYKSPYQMFFSKCPVCTNLSHLWRFTLSKSCCKVIA